MDLTRTITNNHKRLYEINQTTNKIKDDLKQMNIVCNNINDLNKHAVTVVHTVTQKANVLKDQDEKVYQDQKKKLFMVI